MLPLYSANINDKKVENFMNSFEKLEAINYKKIISK